MKQTFFTIIITSLLFFNLIPCTFVQSSQNCNENNCDCNDDNEQVKEKRNLNDERELLLIKKNINYLSNDEKSTFNQIYQDYNMNNTLTDEDKSKLLKLKTTIIKNKLGDDYINFLKIIKKDKTKLTDKEKQQLRYYFEKLQK